MIDYYKTNGAEGHFDDIDVLDGKKVDVSKVDSPRDIRNRKKIEYIPRTIRINEFTDASLKAMAEECGMNINTAINSILDGYVNEYQDEICGGYKMKERVLNNYLDRVVNELKETKLNSEEKKWKRTIRRETEPIILETGDVYVEGFWREFFNVTIYKPSSNNEPLRFEVLDDKYKRQHIDTFSSDFVLYMPEKKWFTVMSILMRYDSKCSVLRIERKLDEESMKKLIDVISKSKTNKTLIKNLTNALKHSDQVGRVREGSIWPWTF